MDEENRTEELERNDEDTREEAEEVVSGEMDSEEAHRYGEFRELMDELRSMREEMSEGFKAIREGMGVFVESGAVVSEGADTVTETEELDEIKTDAAGNILEYIYDVDDDLDLSM